MNFKLAAIEDEQTTDIFIKQEDGTWKLKVRQGHNLYTLTEGSKRECIQLLAQWLNECKAPSAPDNKTVTHKIQYQDIKKVMRGISLAR